MSRRPHIVLSLTLCRECLRKHPENILRVRLKPDRIRPRETKTTARELVIKLCAVAGWTAGQTIYDAFNYYKPMTDDYDVRLRGSLFLPPCVKDLMNCWEIIRQDLVCRYGMKYRIALESMCMDIRFQCKEYTGALPFKVLNVTTWNFCPPFLEENEKIDLRPLGPYSKNDAMGVNNWHTVNYG